MFPPLSPPARPKHGGPPMTMSIPEWSIPTARSPSGVTSSSLENIGWFGCLAASTARHGGPSDYQAIPCTAPKLKPSSRNLNTPIFPVNQPIFSVHRRKAVVRRRALTHRIPLNLLHLPHAGQPPSSCACSISAIALKIGKNCWGTTAFPRHLSLSTRAGTP